MIFKKICTGKKAIIGAILSCGFFGSFFAESIQGKNPDLIAVGQTVEILYACRLENGEIVSSTDIDTIHLLQQDPFSVFIGPGLTENVVIQAGEDALSVNRNSRDKLRDFQAVLKNEIGKKIIGVEPGKTIGMSFATEDTPELLPDERFILMAKRLIRPKQKTLSPASFQREEMESVPTIGKDMTRSTEPWLKAKVTGVDESSVTVSYSADVGETVKTLYGPALVSENETHYLIDIDATVGKLVRAGGFLGRIVDVNEETFTIDFGNAFGGEKICCDVVAQTAHDGAVESVSSDRTAIALSGNQKEKAAHSEFSAAVKMHDGGEPTHYRESPAAESRDTIGFDDVSTERAASGDLVTFDYTLLDGDGALVMTSERSNQENEMVSKSGDFDEDMSSGPVQVVLGKNEIVPFIENALYGMEAGEKKALRLEPRDAYGEKDPEKIKTFPRVKELPVGIETTREEFRKRFGVDPEPGKQIRLVPFFQSRVDAVDGDHVVIKHLVEDGMKVPADLGSTRIAVRDGRIRMTLLPDTGAAFEANGERGVMIGFDDENFIVDFNPPLSGKSFFLDVTVRSVVKKAEYEKEIHWEKGLDEVFEGINTDHKPAVLVLYASWCGWSKKLLAETLNDPRIMSLSDRLIWLKVDTDKERGIYEHYEQQSYPTIVLLDGNGEVYRKMEGYTDPVKLSKALNELM